MQAGHELDEKAGELLGWEKIERDGWWVDSKGFGTCPIFDFKPSTTWQGMGVLVEEARKQGILISIDPAKSKKYCASAIDEDGEDHMAIRETAPHAVCIAFLKAKGVEELI